MLDCPDAIVMKRLQNFKFDPISGRMFSENEISRLDNKALEIRLKDLPNETDEIIKRR